MEKRPFVLCDNLVKIYKVADLEVVALQGLDLEIQEGEIMALVGPSGAGKSTLLNVIGGLDTPSAGNVWVAGRDLLKMKTADRVCYKREVVGFMWQQPARNLLPYLSARENVELPMVLDGVRPGERRERSMALLEAVGLADRAEFRPDRLSGGQQQRIALAVALANNPPLLLGDEVTGQVDSEAASEVFEALRRVNESFGTTIIVVTHDPFVAGQVDRVVAIRDGRTSTEIRRRYDAENDVLHEEEWVILDQAGRLQLPRVFVDTLTMQELVKVRLEEDHVSVWPRETDQGEGAASPRELSVHPVLYPDKEFDAQLPPAVRVEKLTRTFDLGVERVHAVKDVSFEVPVGAMAVLKGPSGSGKTTLLNLIAGLDEPTVGDVAIDGRSVKGMTTAERIDLRRHKLSFVYQTFGLLPFLSAEENVEVPLRLLKRPRGEREERTAEVLELVGLADRTHHRVYELSGGEQQRVALARALASRPSILLADEPTGQLDTVTGAAIIRLMQEIVMQTGITILLASHDPKVMECTDWVFELRDGKLTDSYRPAERKGEEPGALPGGNGGNGRGKRVGVEEATGWPS
jgi:peptide/nickel transport system ATP-binding protein